MQLSTVGQGRQIVGYGAAFENNTVATEVLTALREGMHHGGFHDDSTLHNANYTVDPAGSVTSWNPSAELVKGYARQEILGRHFEIFFTAEDRACGKPAQTLSAAQSQGQFRGEGWRLRKDGTRFWASFVLVAMRDAEGQLIGFAKFARDETRARADEEANDAQSRAWVAARSELEFAHERLKLATDSGGIGIWDWDIQHDVMLWDDWMYRLYGTRRDAGGSGYELWQRHLHPDDRAATEQAVADGVNGVRPYDTIFRIIWDDGSIHHIRGSGSVTRDADGRALRMIGCNQDVTQQIRAERNRVDQQIQSKRWLELAEEIAHVGHWTLGLPDQQIFWSDEIYRIHGREKGRYTPDIVSAVDAYHSDDRDRVSAHITRAIAERTGFEFQARIVLPTGDIRHVLSRGVVQMDENGEGTSIFGVFIDITKQKEIEEKLESANILIGRANEALEVMAYTDSLTGLPNRRAFERTFSVEFRRSIRERAPIGLIMIDIDYFKAFNDLYGHPAGDDCLRRVAAVIGGVLHRPADLAARYGGEEIAVVLPNTNLAGASVIAQSIVEAVRALAIEHRHSPEEIVTVSCGAAAVEGPKDVSEQNLLVEQADRALYGVKRAGRNRASHCLDGVPRAES